MRLHQVGCCRQQREVGVDGEPVVAAGSEENRGAAGARRCRAVGLYAERIPGRHDAEAVIASVQLELVQPEGEVATQAGTTTRIR